MSRSIAPDRLRRLVEELRAGLRAGAAEARSAGEELYRLLIQPALALRPDARRLLLVPDKLLWGVPFAALVVPESQRFLIQEYQLSLAPGLLAKPDRSPRVGGVTDDEVLLVGSPQVDGAALAWLPALPGSRQEVEELSALYQDRQPTVLSGRQATRRRLLERLEQVTLFHFAGHAMALEDEPLSSYLVLAGGPEMPEGGWLTAEELMAGKMERLRLVVLSGCETQRSSGGRLGSLANLAAAFLYRGVPAVVGSLWSVEDRSTAPLMVAFHQQLRRGLGPAAALRQAQLTLLSGGEPPFIWAAFAVLSSALPVGEQAPGDLDRSQSEVVPVL